MKHNFLVSFILFLIIINQTHSLPFERSSSNPTTVCERETPRCSELAFESTNNETQPIFDLIMDLLTLFGNDPKINRRGHLWETTEFETTQENEIKRIEKNFLQKIWEFVWGSSDE